MRGRKPPRSAPLSSIGAVLWSVWVAKNRKNRPKSAQTRWAVLDDPGVAHTVPHIDKQLSSSRRP